MASDEPSKMRRRAAFSVDDVLRRAFIGFLLAPDWEAVLGAGPEHDTYEGVEDELAHPAG
jgi:hypothetical protein